MEKDYSMRYRADLAEWKNNLDQLVKRGKISENTRQRFEQG